MLLWHNALSYITATGTSPNCAKSSLVWLARVWVVWKGFCQRFTQTYLVALSVQKPVDQEWTREICDERFTDRYARTDATTNDGTWNQITVVVTNIVTTRRRNDADNSDDGQNN